MRYFLFWAAALLALPAFAAERVFDFSQFPLEETLTNLHSTVGGKGKPGDWRMILEDAPSLLAPLTPGAPTGAKRAVLAQTARDPRNDHFPIVLLDDQNYGDFTFTARFKIAGGAAAQMAGIVFRYQDERNYYVLTASALDSRFWFFKVADGQRGPLFGPELKIAKNEWHEMSVQCEGNHIHCLLDGKEIIPMLTDNSFGNGQIGLWTKSDSVSYFTDAKITYSPRGILAQELVEDAMKKYKKVLGLKIFAVRAGGKGPVVIASHDEHDLGHPGTAAEEDIIAHGKSYYGRDRDSQTITAPLRDRNGEPIAAVCVVLKSFPGETQDTAVARATPIVKEMQLRVQTLDELLQ